MKDLFSKIEDLKEITDPITVRELHKEILTTMVDDQETLIVTGTSEPFQMFLADSFRMFCDDVEFYAKCVKILQELSYNIKLGYYSEFIDDLCKNETYKSIGYDLLSQLRCKRKESYTEPCKKPKRIKKVSFKTEPTIKYIEKEIEEESIHRNYREEAHNEYQRIYSAQFEERIKEIQWFTPDSVENIVLINRNTAEEDAQAKREGSRIRFTNSNIANKFMPEDLTKKSEDITIKEPKEMPLIDLKIQNTWKKMDFVKIVKNKDFNLKKVLEDPKIINQFQ